MLQGEKLSWKPKYRHFALVTVANAVFPIDNLRYDDARPWKETDARMIQDTCCQIMLDKNGRPVINDPPPTPHRIIICQYGETAQPSWQVGRWVMGGLKFEPISYEEACQINRNREDIPTRLQYPELAKV